MLGRGVLCSAGGRGTLLGCDALAFLLLCAGSLSVVRLGGRGTGCALCAAVALFGCDAAALFVVSRVGGCGTGCALCSAVALFGCGALPLVFGRGSFAVAAVRPFALLGRALIAGLLVTGALRAVTTPAPWKAVGFGVAATSGRP